MAKKIVNTSNTLQINFEKGAKKDSTSSPGFFRFRIIFAAFLFGIGTLLLVAFASNFFVGVADQSELEQGSIDVLNGSDIPVKNFAGLLGAKIAHFFLFRTFGWSSFLLIPLFYLSALKLGFKREVYPLDRLSWQVLFYIIWGSLVAGFLVFQLDLPHSLGGGVGFFINEKLNQLIGYLSVFLILFVGFVFLVIFYQLNPKQVKAVSDLANDTSAGFDEGLSTDFADDFIDEDGPSIHEDNEDLEVFRPIVPPEKVEEISVEETLLPNENEAAAEDDLSFTYKVAVDETPVEEVEDSSLAGQELKANDLVQQFGLYDPTADLPKYVYPTLDILK